MIATHPSDRELHGFLLGKLADSDHSQVESHLAECSQCGNRALTAPADDTLTELLAAARTRFDSQRASAPTPTLDGSATPPAFAPTLAWSSSAGSDCNTAPAALATHPKYRVLRRLGTGGMGTVWLAEHQVMNRPVAVKVIRPDLLARPGATGRFLREVRAAAKLHHPNIATAFDAEPVGDSCLLVMEYVPGQTLGERLEAGPLPVAEACRAVRDAARGLAHAHAAGLVHRDVKPHNLIRAGDGTTKVLDFGLAGVGAGEALPTASDGLTGAGMVVGTPDYIAPEQIADPHAADARADIYGLGCTLYHLLAGRPPLPDGSVAEKLAAQPTHEPDPIPGLAAELSAVLAKMLAKRADDRYQTADEVVDALERIIDDVRPMPARKWSCSGKPWSLAATLLFAAIVIAAGVVFKIYRDNQEITVTTDDPDIEVVMKRKGEVLRVIDKKTGQEWEIDTAKNEIARADTPDGLALAIPEKDGIVLKRNGRAVFTVTRVASVAPSVAGIAPRAPRLVRTIDDRRFPHAIAFTPDGKALLVAGQDSFTMYELGTGNELFQEKFKFTAPNPALAVSADGRTAVVASFDLFVYDLAARKRVPLPETERKKPVFITALTLSPNGQTVAYVAGREAVYLDLTTKQAEHTRPDDGNVRLLALRYSPDGRFLAVASQVEPDQKTRISILDAKTRELLGRVESNGLSEGLRFSPDGRQLFISGTANGQQTFAVLGVVGAKEVEVELDLPAGRVAPIPSPDGRVLALVVNDRDVHVWDRDKKQMIFAWNPHPDARSAFGPRGGKAPPIRMSVAFSPDGRTLATARGNEIRIWDLRRLTPEEIVLEDVERRIDPAKGDGKSLPFALLEQNKVAALWFGKWRLVFEGVPCDSRGKVLFGVGAFFFPEAGGRGNFVDPGLKGPAPMLGQQWNGRTNEIILKNYRFELEAKGTRLVFADKTYEATDRVQTIFIARDGTTRLEPAVKK